MTTFHDMGPGREEAMCNRQGVEHSDARDGQDRIFDRKRSRCMECPFCDGARGVDCLYCEARGVLTAGMFKDLRDRLCARVVKDDDQQRIGHLKYLLMRCVGYLADQISERPDATRFDRDVRLVNDIIRELDMPNEERIPWSLEGSEE